MKDKIFDVTSITMLVLGISLAGILAFATGMLWPSLFGLLLAAIGGGVVTFRWLRNRSAEKLIRTGLPIKAEFVEIRLNEALEINGKNPFQIVARWHDESTNQIHLFKSRSIWFDPTSFIESNDITVYLEPTARRKYYMDTSFLPKLATGA